MKQVSTPFATSVRNRDSAPVINAAEYYVKVSQPVSLTLQGDIAVVTIDNPPVNALSPGVAEAVRDEVLRAAANPAVAAIVVIGAGTTFIAGADIRELAKVAAGEQLDLDLLKIVLDIESAPKPVVMALHGTAFGGGLEVAMGGHYRVIAPSGQVGQPEVKIGLIPGAGGTQRLPRWARRWRCARRVNRWARGRRWSTGLWIASLRAICWRARWRLRTRWRAGPSAVRGIVRSQ
jgi:1,4-dihydroxy-2-naphthoyl-CoA synthase